MSLQGRDNGVKLQKCYRTNRRFIFCVHRFGLSENFHYLAVNMLCPKDRNCVVRRREILAKQRDMRFSVYARPEYRTGAPLTQEREFLVTSAQGNSPGLI